jgi:formylglycine-generating enzyme required for sulfatase activity
MNRRYDVCCLSFFVISLCMLNSPASAHEKVVVVPLSGTVGDALTSDVLKGKTFSSKAAGKGVKGTLELSPTAQSYTNANNMTFNRIPAGTFIMGSSDGEPGAIYSEEKPAHQVTLTKSFYMQTTEVTQKQWQDVMHSAPAGSNTGEDYPIDKVNWFELAYFANELSALESPVRTACYDLSACSGVFGSTYTCSEVGINSDCTGYRLPTEAEWEYAARATTTTPWSYLHSYDTSAAGEETGLGFNPNVHTMGWYEFNNAGGSLTWTIPAYPAGSKPVAKKQPNKWGLYDMHGNVDEWCQDWFDDYSGDVVTNPQGPATPSATYGSVRVMRGGNWYGVAGELRPAYRFWFSPGVSYLGGRLVLSSGQ